jgi:hypothetical protein
VEDERGECVRLCHLWRDDRGRFVGRVPGEPQAREPLRAPGTRLADQAEYLLAPTKTSGQQVVKGIIYSDASGKPQKLLGVSEQLTFHSTDTASLETKNEYEGIP